MDIVDTISQELLAAVADAGTYTAAYPTNRDEGSYQLNGHQLTVAGATLYSPADFTVAFGATEVTVTNASGASWPIGTVRLGLKRGGNAYDLLPDDRVRMAPVIEFNLGAPDTADADGVCASQAITAAGTGTIAGALASGGVATFDVPRNVVAAWTTTAVMTVTGTDEYGKVVVESSASGTSLTGKKAFKTVTAVDVSVDVTGATVGTGTVLGLPRVLESAGQVLAEMEDGAAPTAGTIVAAATAEPSATTGDIRGTYAPNGAPNGGKTLKLLVALRDPQATGGAQYAG